MPAVESDLRATGPGELLGALGEAEGSRGTTAVVRAGEDERPPSRLWALCLALAVLALVTEALLANRILLDARGAASVNNEGGRVGQAADD